MDARRSRRAAIRPQARRPVLLDDAIVDLLGGAVLRQARDAGLGRVPVALAVLVEVGGLVGQAPQGVAEGRRRLSPGCTQPSLMLPVLEARCAAGVQRRRRAEVDRARHAPAGRVAAEVGVLAVEAQAAASSGRPRPSR